jgi:hypothetical protein
MITLENFAQTNDIGCFVNVLVQIKDLQGSLLHEQFMPGSKTDGKITLPDFWQYPAQSEFFVDVTNLSAMSCLANVSFITDLAGDNTVIGIPNGFTLRYRHVNALPLLEIRGVGALPESATFPLCTIDTTATYNEANGLVQLSKITSIATALIAAFLPNVSYFSGPDGLHYPNPWFFKKKVCSVSVENVENCFDAGGQSAGIGQYINFVNSNDLLGTPEILQLHGSTTNDEFVSAVGSFSYVTGKKFSRLQTLADSRLHDLTSEGSVGQLSPRSQLVFRLPNSRAALGALKKMANTPGIIVFTNGSDHKIILGTKIFPAKISAFTTKQSETESYIEITITSGTKYPMYWSGTL